MIDPILQMMDRNTDGYITWEEYMGHYHDITKDGKKWWTFVQTLLKNII